MSENIPPHKDFRYFRWKFVPQPTGLGVLPVVLLVFGVFFLILGPLMLLTGYISYGIDFSVFGLVMYAVYAILRSVRSTEAYVYSLFRYQDSD